MSLHLTAQFIAQAIGSSVGGLILMAYGFDGLGWFSLSQPVTQELRGGER
jgi:predicted MFS family arabinose efflux permease